MKKTGVFATSEEKENIQAALKRTQGPVMYLSGGIPIHGSMEDVFKKVYSAAIAHGLPEIPGEYGLSEEGEFLTV